jgi:hypothetical protein
LALRHQVKPMAPDDRFWTEDDIAAAERGDA